jgi:hypothetical protein
MVATRQSGSWAQIRHARLGYRMRCGGNCRRGQSASHPSRQHLASGATLPIKLDRTASPYGPYLAINSGNLRLRQAEWVTAIHVRATHHPLHLYQILHAPSASISQSIDHALIVDH